MTRIILALSSLFMLNAQAGLQPFETVPRTEAPTMLTEPFSDNYWNVMGITFSDDVSEHENIMNITKSMGSGILFHYDHHTFVCYTNASQYFYFYESGWGPGYALTKGAIPGIEDCVVTQKPFALGSGIKIGMPKSELESILGVSGDGNIYDIRYESVVNIRHDDKLCPIWHSTTLNISLKNNAVSAVYFDNHSEPYDECKPI